MRHTLYLMILCLGLVEAQAQKLSKSYTEASLSDVLIDLNRSQTDSRISFIYNELEDFTVTTSFRNQPVGNAVRQVVGFYPMKITENDSLITVECIQKETQKVIGRVINEQGQPVEFANVALLLPADSSFINGGVTNANGDFVIPCRPGHMLIRVSFVGYKTHYQPCTVGEVGSIRLRRDAIVLKNITVRGEIPQYKATTGGMTVEIQNSILKDVGTADDLLSMLPRVEGSDGKFTVFAKGEPEIYINNKKVRDAKELKQLKSTDIKSVDIITSPGAKYNAEVNAVIRIKTIKRQDDGLSVEAYGQVSYNEKWTTYDDVTVKYRTGGLEVFGNMAVNNGNHSEDNMLHTDIRANGNHVGIDQYAPSSFWYTNLSGKVGSNYDLNDSTSLGLSYELSGFPYQGGDAHSTQTIARNDIPEGIVSQYMDYTGGEDPQHNANIYFIGKVGRLGIDFNGSWIWKKNVRDQTSFEQSRQLDDRTVTTHNENRNHMLAGKLVLSYPVWKGELSAGTEMSRSNSHGTYHNVEQVLEPSDDEIRESNVAGFAEYNMKLGDWSISGGLRYESVSSDYYSFGEHQAEPSRQYRDLFPNLSVGWQKGKWGVELSYNKRISRPYYRLLSSNVQYDTRYTYEGGNPLLRPTVRQNLDLSVTYAWLNFTAGYSHRKDEQLDFGSQYQEGTEIVIWTNRNFRKYESYNASLTASPKFGCYTPTLTLSYWQQNFDTRAYGLDTKLDKPQFEINFRNWLAIGKTAKAMLYLHYSTSHNWGFNYFAHEFNVNARIQKTFLGGSLTAVLTANDIFRTLRERWTGYYPVTTMDKDAYVFTRNIGLSLTYNFNATRSKYKGTGAGNAEKSRL